MWSNTDPRIVGSHVLAIATRYLVAAYSARTFMSRVFAGPKLTFFGKQKQKQNNVTRILAWKGCKVCRGCWLLIPSIVGLIGRSRFISSNVGEVNWEI
jgi:hypothetical protein